MAIEMFLINAFQQLEIFIHWYMAEDLQMSNSFLSACIMRAPRSFK